jgi:hypothetical protein
VIPKRKGQKMKTWLFKSAFSRLARLLVVVAALGASVSTRALVSVEFYGTLTEVAPAAGDTTGLATSWGAVGDPFWGTLSYDPLSSQPGGWWGPDGVQYVFYPAVPHLLVLDTASQHAELPGVSGYVVANVVDSPTLDSFTAAGESYAALFMTLTLEDSTGTALSDTSLPTKLDLSDWTRGSIDLEFVYGGIGHVRGDIASLHSVPDSGSSAMLLVFAFGALLLIPSRARVAR